MNIPSNVSALFEAEGGSKEFFLQLLIASSDFWSSSALGAWKVKLYSKQKKTLIKQTLYVLLF